VLLRKVLEVFPFYLNFLDGDILFRNLHSAVDVFVDENNDLSVLTGKIIIRRTFFWSVHLYMV
jgi:hypothetical protein